MKLLYDRLVYPHLIGNISIWGTSSRTAVYLKPLITTQKWFVRLIKNLPRRAHTQKHMQELKILDIPNLFTFRLCTQMHSYIYDQDRRADRPEHIHHYTKVKNVHSHATRRAKNKHCIWEIPSL